MSTPRKCEDEKSVAIDRPPVYIPGERNRVEKLLQGIKLVLYHHGARKAVVNSFYKQAYTYLSVPHEEIFIKRAKYLLLVPMARYLGNELPVPPDLLFRAEGHWRRWSESRIKSYRCKNTHLWYSFLQAKRAAAPVSKSHILEVLRKHRSQMMAPDPLALAEGVEGNEELLYELLENIDPLLMGMTTGPTGRKLHRIFRRPDVYIAKYAASQNASQESSRKTGGQKGVLRELTQWTCSPQQGDLGTMIFHPGTKILARRLVSNATVVKRVVPTDMEPILERIAEYSQGDMPPLNAEATAVVEPLKPRIISKGPAIEYWSSKPIQKAFHSHLRKKSPFRLIGRPFSIFDIMDVRKAQESLGGLDGHYWLSIDYSAATDGLSAALSREIIRTIISPCAYENPGYYQLLLAVLAPHRVGYPLIKGIVLDDVQQLNGQLMGSPLSFPILCLANLALYLTVRRRLRPKASVKKLLKAVLINGDDMIYIGTREEWELHKELGAKMGLSMSPGKAYIHYRYANINSICIDYSLRGNCIPRVIPFLNVGLYVGNHKVLSKVGEDDNKHKAYSVIDKLLEGCWENTGVASRRKPPTSVKQVKVDLLRGYLSLHSKTLKAECGGRNIFLPTSVGGLGQKPPKGFKVFVTKKQRGIYGRIIKRQPWLVPDVRPLPRGREIDEVEDRLFDPLGEAPLPGDGYARVGKQGDYDLFTPLIAYKISK